jgi:D-alanine-D-alanine ligase
MASRVGVLMGGKSAEREISLRSGHGVLGALQSSGFDAVAFDPAERPMDDLLRLGVDRVFIALHGRYGEDGTVQGALELLEIPYTGSGVLASALAMDKLLTKRVWQSWGIPTPGFVALRSEQWLTNMPTDTSPGSDKDRNAQAYEVIAHLGLPVAIKPAHEGSSLGFTRVDNPVDTLDAIRKAAQTDEAVVAEAFVQGREFTVALLGGGGLGPVRALPVVEIVAPQGNYDFQHKYFGSETRYLCPAPLPSEVRLQMQTLSARAFDALGCEGWARVDILWDEKDSPTLLELNTSPGMTDHSLVPMAAAQMGLSYAALVCEILAGARLKLRRAS